MKIINLSILELNSFAKKPSILLLSLIAFLFSTSFILSSLSSYSCKYSTHKSSRFSSIDPITSSISISSFFTHELISMSNDAI